MNLICQHQDCMADATQQGVHASSDCLIKVCDEHAEEITQDGHWVPGYEPRSLDL